MPVVITQYLCGRVLAESLDLSALSVRFVFLVADKLFDVYFDCMLNSHIPHLLPA